MGKGEEGLSLLFSLSLSFELAGYQKRGSPVSRTAPAPSGGLAPCPVTSFMSNGFQKSLRGFYRV